jgi:hypothetical protein
LFKIAIRAHVITFFALVARREILYKVFEEVFCIEVILIVVIRIRVFIIHVLIAGSSLYIRKNIFKELRCMTIVLIGIILFRHFGFILIIFALKDLGELIGACAQQQYKCQ